MPALRERKKSVTSTPRKGARATPKRSRRYEEGEEEEEEELNLGDDEDEEVEEEEEIEEEEQKPKEVEHSAEVKQFLEKAKGLKIVVDGVEHEAKPAAMKAKRSPFGYTLAGKQKVKVGDEEHEFSVTLNMQIQKPKEPKTPRKNTKKQKTDDESASDSKTDASSAPATTTDAAAPAVATEANGQQ